MSWNEVLEEYVPQLLGVWKFQSFVFVGGNKFHTWLEKIQDVTLSDKKKAPSCLEKIYGWTTTQLYDMITVNIHTNPWNFRIQKRDNPENEH